MDPVQLAAVLAVTVVVASMISVEDGLSVALIEWLGVVAATLFSLDPNTDWLEFSADPRGRPRTGDRARRQPEDCCAVRIDRRELAAIFVGGFVGAIARAGLVELFPTDATEWPWATFIANVIGAFALGYFVTRLQERLPSRSIAVRFSVRGSAAR